MPMHAAATHLAELEPPSQVWLLSNAPGPMNSEHPASPKAGDNLSATGVSDRPAAHSEEEAHHEWVTPNPLWRCWEIEGCRDALIRMLWPDWLKCEDVWVPIQASAKGLSITLQKSSEHTTYLHLMVYFKTSHCVPHSWDVWENWFNSKTEVNSRQEFQGIKYIHWRKMDHSTSRCKMIGFISSQTLPQVTLGMLEIMKYKIPLLHITYFPHHYLCCRFTITLTSKLRKLFLYSKQRVLLPLLGQ